MKTGVVLGYGANLIQDFDWCVKHNIPTCQLSVPVGMTTSAHAKVIDTARRETGMEITALIGNWSGPNTWNFLHGPATLGIVPPAYRHQRMQELLQCAHLAEMLMVPHVCTHMGFIPENPGDTLYQDFVSAVRSLADDYERCGLNLNFETGQETPVTLLRVMGDIDKNNVGLNFDPANLLMYGKANPVDALDMVAPYVRGVHAKDGEYPTDGYHLGLEKPLGQGRVNFPLFIQKLRSVGYDGALTIEREITGEAQKQDVLMANRMLLDILNREGEKKP